MKLLRIKASGFKNLDDTVLDLTARSKKTSEDKEYELVKVADELYVYSIGAFIGKNASGKTTALELLDCCFHILGEFCLESSHYDYTGVQLEMFFYHEEYIYRYTTVLRSDPTLGGRATFSEQHLFRKKYYKTKVSSLFSEEGFMEMCGLGELPEDTSIVFFVLKKKQTLAMYFDSEGNGSDTYRLLFRLLKAYNLSGDILASIIRIFDGNVEALQMIDEHNFRLRLNGMERICSDRELLHLLSSGTTKGMLLYVMAAVSLRCGFDLLIDEIENHFHKTLVENLISLYMDKSVNRSGASLLFTTHYCEIIDLFNRQDNIWICRAEEKITIQNMYDSFGVRSGLLKSRRFYNNTFGTAVNYNELMNLKRMLMK